jgi:mono/diheme cytochrome c family protein
MRDSMFRPMARVTARSRRIRLAGLAAMLLAMPACTDAAGYDLDYIMGRVPFLATMRSTVAIESQVMPRLPAEGSVAFAGPNAVEVRPFSQAELDSFAAGLANPLPASPEVLARGAQVYGNVCFACHGVNGAGNGPVVGPGKFPMGPALNNASAAGRTDGYIYGVIRVGRGLMPAYADRISESDRWAVVHFLRQQQGAAGVLAAGQ